MQLPQPTHANYSNLINDISRGQIKIPQFQRDFVWSIQKSVALMDSVIKGYPSPPSQSWRTFLTNHADCLASIDFFVVPTATFHLLFGFIVLHHERRQIVHFGVTANPTMAWVAQQIREAFPWGTAPRYLIRDRDGAYGQSFRSTVTAIGRGRGRHGATEPVAKSVCGTPDRQREARMPGPFDHPQRAAFAAHSWLIPRLLSRFKDPPVDRQGHTGWTTRSAGRVRNGRFLPKVGGCCHVIERSCRELA